MLQALTGVGVVLLGVLLCAQRPVSGALCPLLKAPVASAEQKTGSYMIVFKEEVNQSSWQELKEALPSLSRDSHIGCTVEKLVKMVSVTLTEENLNIVRSWPEVEYVEEETRVEGMQERVQWHTDRLDQPRPPLDGHFLPVSSGEGVDVYVMDSGIAYGHEEFGGRAKYSGYDPMDVYRRETRRGLDCHGHGTQVASLVAGSVSGLAKGAHLYSVRVLDCDNVGVWSVVIAGLDHIFRLASPRHRPAVAVLGFSGPYSRTVSTSLQLLYNRGILAVVSAGNGGSNACNYSPGWSSYTLTAGGTDRTDSFYESSNYGTCVDVLAPASEVRTADWLCSSCYKMVNGTSSSAALTAGVAAIILSREPLLSPAQLKNRVQTLGIRNVLTMPAHVVTAGTQNLLIQVPGGCGGHYLTPVIISSPNFPRNYPDNLSPCKWSISADVTMATQVQCNVTSFVTEAGYDQVQLCDGLLCCLATSLDQLSGVVETRPSYTSTSGALTVEFLTDGSSNYRGFSFTCESVGGVATTRPPTSMVPSTGVSQTVPVTSDLPTSDLPTSNPSVGTISSTDLVTGATSGSFLTSAPTSPVTSEAVPVTAEPTSEPATLLTSEPATLFTSEPVVSPPTSEPLSNLSTTDSPTPFPGVVVNETVEVDEVAALVAGVVADVVGEAVSVLQELVATSMNNSLSSRLYGRLQQYPVTSCLHLASSASLLSGYYWLRAGNGSAVRVFCDVASTFGAGPQGYMRVADLDMSRPLEACPDALRTRADVCQKKLCGRGDTLPGCSSIYYSTFGIPFRRVCGRVQAYRYGTPNGFFAHRYDPAVTIDDPYVDGVSLTYGSPRRHIWSFAAAVNLSVGGEPACPCRDASVPASSMPRFVEHQYFCDTMDITVPGHCNVKLWEGKGCGPENSCCSMQSQSPWFCVDLEATVTADIELRVCANEQLSNEDTPLEMVSIYVQ